MRINRYSLPILGVIIAEGLVIGYFGNIAIALMWFVFWAAMAAWSEIRLMRGHTNGS